MRTSDWSSVMVSVLGRVVPRRWRGHRRDRAVREEIIHAVAKAIASPEQYEKWVLAFQELNKLALSGELHSTSLEEIHRIIQA
jgi:hypothetical protein